MHNEPITYKALLTEINSSSIRKFYTNHKVNYVNAMRYLESKGVRPELFRNNITREQLAFLQSKNYSLSQLSQIFGMSLPSLKLLSKEPVNQEFTSVLNGEHSESSYKDYIELLQKLGATKLQIRQILGIPNTLISQYALSQEKLREYWKHSKPKMTDVDVKEYRKLFLFYDNFWGHLYSNAIDQL